MTKIYRKVYRDEVKAIGADAAYFLAELRAFAEFCEQEGYIDENGFFELSAQKVEEMTGFGEHKQKNIFSVLVNSGIIERKFTSTRRFIKILGDKMEPQGVQNGTPMGAKRNPNGGKMEPQWGSKRNPSYYNKQFDKSFDKYLSSCLTEKQQQIIESVFNFFGEKIPDEKKAYLEAVSFINYNRENFGEDHLTARNYKKHATAWIEASKNKPKKKRASGRGKTAREVAESQGLTVDELLKNSGQPKTPETKPENIDPLITELFGG